MKISSVHELHYLKNRFRFKYTRKQKFKDVAAADTETINNTCRLFLLSKKGHDNKTEVKHFFTETFTDFYKLFQSEIDKNTLIFFYNLHYDANAIIRLLFPEIPETDTVRQLCKYLNLGYKVLINPLPNKKIKDSKLYTESFKLNLPELPYSNIYMNYIKRKYFYLSDFRKSVKFYDIMQFYQEKGLDAASLLNLNICRSCKKVNLGKIIHKIERAEPETHFKEYENGKFIRCEKCNNTQRIIRKTFVPDADAFYDNETVLRTPEFISYAENDIIVTEKLVKNLYNIFDELNLVVNSPISQAKIAKIAYFNHNEFSENIFTTPFKYMLNNNHVSENFRLKFIQYCINAFTGGLFMTLKKGTFRRETGDGVFLADLKSAYPSVQHLLKSIMNLELDFKRGEPPDVKALEIDGGVLKVEIRQNDEYFNIFPVHLKNGAVTYPNTENKYFTSYISASDYFLYKDMASIDIKVIDGFYYRYNSDALPYYYLKDYYYYRQKLKAAGNPAEHGIKITINSTFGATIQTTKKYKLVPYNAFLVQQQPDLKPVRIYDQYFLEIVSHYDAGIMFNILNGGVITGRTQNKIKAPFINKDYTDYNENIEYLIQLATDSITSTKKLDLVYGDKLGDFELQKNDVSAIIGGNGIISIGEKETDGDDEINKFRGFQTKTDIKQLLRDNSDKSIIELPTTQLIGYTTMTPRVDFNRINKAHLKKINLNQIDYKRIWNKKNVKASDLLNNIFTSKSAILGDYKTPCEYVPLNTARKPDYKHLTSLHEQLAKDKPNTRQRLNNDLYDTHNIDSSLTRAEQQTERRRQTEKTFKEYFEH